jgi:hypothetical protein
MIELIGKNVVVEANGIIYRGVLVEINDKEVHLQTEMGWITIPVYNVNNITEDTETP